ncbi:MAG: ATP-binding cassette domain-containing protein [Proteobacteria bacterium]|nr:ATP-binding cassette domain-containing protein [Pseudomonadota bacterium]
MERNIFRYIWNFSRPEQVVVVMLVVISMIPYYLAFDLPKQIVNGPLQGQGFDTPGSTQPFMALSFDIPFIGTIHLTDGVQLERLPLLVALSFTFLGLVIVNGLFKYVINTRKGMLGERLLRRGRYVLIDRILRFKPGRVAQMKSGEVASMVKDEIEPLGGFSADAFTQPVLLGGQAITALVFIFVQHFWLGTVAGVLAVVQVAIIPRMRRRLIFLGRERQLTARELAGQVAEIVDGIQTIHANDASNLVRARVSARLGRIFKIRYDIYQWKFLVKFINNFIAQITPFFFYLIGGYLTIIGSLDVGQLIAVINAYKELPGPMKELIDWDLARQDVQVKYEQIVEQFDADEMIDPELQSLDAEVPPGSLDPLAAQRLTVLGGNGVQILDNVSFAVNEGDFTALVGASADGAPVLGDVLGGQVAPSSGSIMLGDHDVSQLPERVTGRVIGYTGQSPFLESESVLSNVTYGLMRRPAPIPEGEEPAIREHRLWAHRESARTGNPVLDVDADWIDYDAVQPVPGKENLIGSVCEVLDVVGLGEDIIGFALRSRLNVSKQPELAEEVLALRRALSGRLAEQDLADIVHPFRPDQYNSEATTLENLLFGVPSDASTSADDILAHPFFEATLRDTGLGAMLFDLGWQFASDTVELFESSQGNPEMLQWLTHVRPEELPAYQQTLARTAPGGVAAATREDVTRLILLAFQYVEPVYRFGLLDDARRDKLIAGREALADRVPADLRGRLQRYDPDVYLNNATLADNILFGKLNRRFVRAEEKIDEIMRTALRELFDRKPAVRDEIMSVGLGYYVGPNGRRLTQIQRQKIVLARSLIRKSRYYVFNEPLAGADPGLQRRVIRHILRFLAAQTPRPGVAWVLTNADLAADFDRRVELQKGRIVAETQAREENAAAVV